MKRPAAWISKQYPVSTTKYLENMLEIDPELYDLILKTPGFAYAFNQITNKAIHYDFIVSYLLPNYETECDADEGYVK